MRYALFLGCTIPVRAQNYELATRKIGEVLGIEFVDIPTFSCCGFPIKSIDAEESLLVAARNLAEAEERGLNICTICSACTGVLTEVNNELKNNPELRNEINRKLSEMGKEYKGTVEIKHLARILLEDVPKEKFKENIKADLSDIKVCAHYGCHYLKPTEIYEHFDSAENPQSLDKLIELTGAKSLRYQSKRKCCGGAVLAVDESLAMSITKEKLDNIKDVEADAIVLICPFCSIMYESNQKKIESTYNVSYNLPVLYYPQLLGLAFGFNKKDLGFNFNRVKADKLTEKIKKLNAVIK